MVQYLDIFKQEKKVQRKKGPVKKGPVYYIVQYEQKIGKKGLGKNRFQVLYWKES